MDLRRRVVDAVEREGLSCNRAAARYAIAISTAIDWVNRYRRTGNLAPGQIGGHRPKKLVGGTGSGCSSAAGAATSPWKDWSGNWRNGGCAWTTASSGRLFTRKG